jgi:hypothetical protein
MRAAQLASVMGTEAMTPASNRIVANDDVSMCQEFLDISWTQRRLIIVIDGVRYDFGWKTETAIG